MTTIRAGALGLRLLAPSSGRTRRLGRRCQRPHERSTTEIGSRDKTTIYEHQDDTPHKVRVGYAPASLASLLHPIHLVVACPGILHEGDNMPTIVGYHDITKGQDHWLRSQKRKELFGPLGVTNIRTFVDPQNPKRVAVMMDVPDMDALKAVMQSPAAAEAMAHDGVVPETLVILVEA